jgi:hypothetical protein
MSLMIKSKYISDILDLLLDEDEDESLLRSQIEYLTDSTYNYTGIGLSVSFSYSEDILKSKLESKTTVLDGVSIQSEEVEIGAYALLFIKDGIIENLEISSLGGKYPAKDISSYELTQTWENSPGRKIVQKRS